MQLSTSIALVTPLLLSLVSASPAVVQQRQATPNTIVIAAYTDLNPASSPNATVTATESSLLVLPTNFFEARLQIINDVPSNVVCHAYKDAAGTVSGSADFNKGCDAFITTQKGGDEEGSILCQVSDEAFTCSH